MQRALTLLLFTSSFAAMAQPSVSQPPPAAETPLPVTQKVSSRDADKAERLYLDGAKHFKAGDMRVAEEDFAHATGLNPTRTEYPMALAMVRQARVSELITLSFTERQHGHLKQADDALLEARALDPENPLVKEHLAPAAPAKVAVAPHRVQRYAGAIELRPQAKKESFHLRADTKSMFQQVAARYGIQVSFDPQLTSKSLRLDVDDIDYPTVLHILGIMAHVMTAPLTEHSIVVADDTAENHTRLDRLVEETLLLPGLSREEVNDMSNVLKNVFEVNQATSKPSDGTILVRAPADVMDDINLTLDDLLDGGSEVMVNLKLFAVSESNTQSTGLTPPQQINVLSAAGLAQSILSQNQSLISQLIASGAIPANTSPVLIALYLAANGLVSNSSVAGTIVKFGGGLSTGLISAANNPTLQLALSRSDTRELDDVQLRIGDRQSGVFRIGSRYPIISSVYSNVASVSAGSALANATVNGVSVSSLLSQFLGSSSTAGSTIPQIQYEDIGLTFKATPHVLRGGDIALQMDLKIEALTGQSLNSIPILESRQMSTEITVPNGDTAMVMNDLNTTEAKAVSGTPGLSELPGFQDMTAVMRSTSSENLILLITPVIVRHGHLNLAGPYLPFTEHQPSE